MSWRRATMAAAALLVAGTVTAAEQPAATAVVRATTEEMAIALRRDREVIEQDRERLYRLVEDIVVPRFDFQRMSRGVLGKKVWSSASETQRDEFVAQFRTLLVRTYAAALASYRDEQIVIRDSRPRARGVVKVRTVIEQRGGPPIPVDYLLYLSESKGWQVFDVAVDGVSLVINYRSTFASEVRKGGIEGLLVRLAEHNGTVR